MKDTESLKVNSQQPNRKEWESPQLESWNTEEMLALNPLHFLLNTDQTLTS
ncbi:hypothetical protein V7S77_04395 [Aquirufa ecclesiirivi]